MTDDAITDYERSRISQFVTNSPKLTQGKVVKQFEKEWSEWLGVKHSLLYHLVALLTSYYCLPSNEDII